MTVTLEDQQKVLGWLERLQLKSVNAETILHLLRFEQCQQSTKPLLAKNLIGHNLRNLKISALRSRFDIPRFNCKKQIMAPVLPFEQQNFHDGRIIRASSNGKAGIEVG